MKVPTHATSMNETPIKKYFTEQLLVESSQANDPDCCLSILWQISGGWRVLQSEKQRPERRFTGRCDSSSLRLTRNHNRIGANVLPKSYPFQYCVFDHTFADFLLCQRALGKLFILTAGAVPPPWYALRSLVKTGLAPGLRPSRHRPHPATDRSVRR